MMPGWLKTALGTVGQVLAKPTKGTRRMLDSASYIGIAMGEAFFEICQMGIAKPLSELKESKLQKIKSVDVADAARAHNESEAIRLEAEADAELTKAKAEKKLAEARSIDGEAACRRLKEERKLAEAQRDEVLARLEAAVTQLRIKGGDLYLPDGLDADEEEPDAS